MNWYKKANQLLPSKFKKRINELVRDIMVGNRDWSPEQMQLYNNNHQLIENILKDKALDSVSH